MWKLKKPALNALEVYNTLVNSMDDGEKKTRLQGIARHIEIESTKYEEHGDSKRLEQFEPHDQIQVGSVIVTKSEMKELYGTKMVDERRGDFYDALKLLPQNSTCPYCCEGKIDELDHHLPKSIYPSFVVTPLNLVPVCIRCNKKKKNLFPRSEDRKPFNPYFENLEHDLWLKARVNESKEALEFYIDPPSSWGTSMRTRIKDYFDLLELETLYVSKSAVTISGMAYKLSKWSNQYGVQEIKDRLHEDYESERHKCLNHWKTATLCAISSNDWFCNGGF